MDRDPPHSCCYCDIIVGHVVLVPMCVAFAGFPCVPEVSPPGLEAPRGQGKVFGFPDLPLVLGWGGV